ncbi:MAG: 16S rRNA (cytidine(1402)-2'-O)-methyltransferase [Bacilli bacterium]|nr:16S rRNA (cytidine(1402)-2'-O)-methyltransferase [Bacilli bacterium]
MRRNKSFDGKSPLLYLIAVPIGNLKEMTPRALEVISECDLIASEDTRNTKALLSKFNIRKDVVSLREHNEVKASMDLIEKIKSGLKVAYMSDAGYPGISDPGKILVQKAKENGIVVSTISGSCAFINALTSSFLPSNRFYFHGFLNPVENKAKQELEDLKDRKETLIFYESPHRIDKTIMVLYKVLGNREATIARELTKINEEFIEGTLEELTHLDKETLIGEMVVIVSGNKEENKEIDESIILNELNILIESGMSKKDAIKEVSNKLKIAKNRVYDLANSIK